MKTCPPATAVEEAAKVGASCWPGLYAFTALRPNLPSPTKRNYQKHADDQIEFCWVLSGAFMTLCTGCFNQRLRWQ